MDDLRLEEREAVDEIRGRRHLLSWVALCTLLVATALAERATPSPSANAPPAVVVRSILTGEFGFAHPTGLTYLAKKRMLLVAARGRSRTRLLRLDPFEDALGTLTLPRVNASTLSFNPIGARLMAVSGERLVTVRSAQLDMEKPPTLNVDISHLGLRNPQGATFDPTKGIWLILDSDSRTIVRVSASGRHPRRPIRLALRNDAGPLRGLARNPVDGLLYVASPRRGLLYGVKRSGEAQKIYTIKKLRNLKGMVFAPSTDPTDRRATQHLYVADAGTASRPGRVVELSLEPDVELAGTVQGRLAQTIQTGRLDLPSPDPAGITYLASSDRLLMSDSEVDEMPLYRGANLFQLTRTGALVESGTTLTFSREPSGVGFDPNTRTLFISDDEKDAIFVVGPGLDGRYGTADDSVTTLSTHSFESHDPEDVAFDPDSGHLFVADGIGAEVYELAPVNGVFGDGDDSVTHFDVAQFGVRNCEGVGFDPRRKTLLVVASEEGRIFELTSAGTLVRIISLPQVRDPDRALADVTVAPTSNPRDNASAMSYWVADRRIDNNANPNENDGRIYEVSLP